MAATAPVGNRPTVADSPRRHVLFQHFVVTHEELGKTIQDDGSVSDLLAIDPVQY